MCGIAGIWHPSGKSVAPELLRRMTDSLRHRGPDGEGQFLADGIGLGHRRLSIVDLSEAADQPMALPDGSLWMTFNGEIHNYLELRVELEAKGVQFRTQSDTEVVLWSYRTWGFDCFARFNGMWALAIWETDSKRLILSRDRFGIKPLFYSSNGERIVFASEAKAILAAFPEERVADEQTVFDFMAGGWPQSSENTFFRSIRSVQPAHCLIADQHGQSSKAYWCLEPRAEENFNADRLRELLFDAVRLRLRSDVPVGVCLSGGLDSSIVAAMMYRQANPDFNCFSLKYDNPRNDESGYAAAVHEQLSGAGLHWVRPRPEEILGTMARIVSHYDSPTAIRGKYPKWYVMETVAKHNRVVLEGHGADELLGGYGHFVIPHLVDILLNRHGAASAGGMREAFATAHRIGRARGGIGRLLVECAKNLIKQRVAPAGWFWESLLSREARHCYRAPPANRTRYAWLSVAENRRFKSFLQSALWSEVSTAGLPESLHATDATSMAFSVESRPPFLDHRVVEYCFAITGAAKFNDGWSKWPLRELSVNLIPDNVRWRQKKMGYPGAYTEWLTAPHVIAKLRDVAVGGPARDSGLLDSKRLDRIGATPARFAEFVRSGPERAWRLVTLQYWYDQAINRVGQGME